VRGRVKKSQYEFRRRSGLKTLQKACTPSALDWKTGPVKRCVEIFYWLGVRFKDDRLREKYLILVVVFVVALCRTLDVRVAVVPFQLCFSGDNRFWNDSALLRNFWAEE
jgi:hypothetical protein